MARNRCNCYFSFWAIFLLFYLSNNPKIKREKKKEKKRKKRLKIASLYNSVTKILIICYTVPEIWHVTDIIIFHFLPFYPTNSLKNQNLQKWKKQREISSFYTSVPKVMIICYTVPEIWRMRGVIDFLPFYPLTAQKIEIKKYTKIMIRWCTVPEIWCVTDGWTDRRTEKVRHRGGVPPKNTWKVWL